MVRCHFSLTLRGETNSIFQRDRLVIIDLDLHADGHDQRIGGRHSEQQGLLVLAFDAACGDRDLPHPGVGVEFLVFDKAKLLVARLLVLRAELHPSRPFSLGCRSARSDGGPSRHRLRYLLAFLRDRRRCAERKRKRQQVPRTHLVERVHFERLKPDFPQHLCRINTRNAAQRWLSPATNKRRELTAKRRGNRFGSLSPMLTQPHPQFPSWRQSDCRVKSLSSVIRLGLSNARRSRLTALPPSSALDSLSHF